MKIFLIGSDLPHSFETCCARVFRELGAEVVHSSNRKPLPAFLNREWGRMNRVERSAYNEVRGFQIYREICAERPDMVFLIKAENIRSAAIRRALEETGARLGIWYVDNPFHADVTSHQVLKNLKIADVFYTRARSLIDALRSAGCRRVKYLPFGYDEVTHPHTVECSDVEAESFGADICFLGSWDKEREVHLAGLAEMDLAIYGRGWGVLRNTNSPIASAVRSDAVWGEDVSVRFQQAKIVLNLMRVFDGGSHNFRTMEATGIGGGVLLTKRTPEQCAELFQEGEHLFAYEREEEIVDAAREILKLSEAKRREVSQKARAHVEEHHLLRYRLQEVLEDFS